MMIDIKTLQDKHIYDLSDEEQNAIQSAYLRYFDTENVRNRAIGYCVLRGGVPTKRIGQIMINFRWLFIDQTGHTETDDPIDRVGYRLTFGTFPLIYDKSKEPALHKALCDYIQSEPRLLNCLRGDIPVDGVSMPLFVALKKGRYDTDVGSYLATCHVLLHKSVDVDRSFRGSTNSPRFWTCTLSRRVLRPHSRPDCKRDDLRELVRVRPQIHRH